MLLRLLKSVVPGLRPAVRAPAAGYPKDLVARQRRAHERAPVDLHVRILYDSVRVRERAISDLIARSLAGSGAGTPPLKALHRPLAAYFLAQYFLHARELGAAQAECGVFRGTSALLMCLAARTREPDYQGAGLHLIDSFEGLSDPSEPDRFAVRNEGDRNAMPRNWLAAPIEHARRALSDFPGAEFHRGWIPEVLATLPETGWSFVHLDVDLYVPTLEGLKYFHPRLVPGGVIVCDDYGAPLFPGAHRAWDEYCDEHDVPYVVLDTGQSVILKA